MYPSELMPPDELQRIIDITGKPVTRITLFHLAKKGLLSEFSEQADIEEYVEALDLLSFSALSRRDFLGRMDRTRLGGPTQYSSANN